MVEKTRWSTSSQSPLSPSVQPYFGGPGEKQLHLCCPPTHVEPTGSWTGEWGKHKSHLIPPYSQDTHTMALMSTKCSCEFWESDCGWLGSGKKFILSFSMTQRAMAQWLLENLLFKLSYPGGSENRNNCESGSLKLIYHSPRAWDSSGKQLWRAEGRTETSLKV